MSVTIADITFNDVTYDAVGDVLYLNVNHPGESVDYDDTPEGHNIGWNAAGEIVSIALLHPRWLLEHDGTITITLPYRVDAAMIDPALVAA